MLPVSFSPPAASSSRPPPCRPYRNSSAHDRSSPSPGSNQFRNKWTQDSCSRKDTCVV
jgi:hypothetical protein